MRIVVIVLCGTLGCAAVGGATGAGFGALAGAQINDESAAVGAAVGAVVGGLLGYEVDKLMDDFNGMIKGKR